MVDRSLEQANPKFWRGKVRVTRIIYDGNERFLAEWKTVFDGDWFWKFVTHGGDPERHRTMEEAIASGKHAWNTDMDAATARRRKVWP